VCASMEWLYSTHSLSSVTNASSCQEVTRTNHIRQEFVLYLAGEMEGGGGGAYLWSVVADGDADARQADGERELLLPPLLHSDEHRTRTHIQTLCNTQVTE
jgi:hypothetical protein